MVNTLVYDLAVGLSVCFLFFILRSLGKLLVARIVQHSVRENRYSELISDHVTESGIGATLWFFSQLFSLINVACILIAFPLLFFVATEHDNVSITLKVTMVAVVASLGLVSVYASIFGAQARNSLEKTSFREKVAHLETELTSQSSKLKDKQRDTNL